MIFLCVFVRENSNKNKTNLCLVNTGNRISEALKLKIFRGSMPLDPPRGYRLRRAFIRTPLRQILDPPQKGATFIVRTLA